MAPGDDGDVLPLLQRLLVIGRLWSVGHPLDADAVRAARDAALLHNHRRYVERIPVYAAMAEDFGLVEVEDVDVLASRMTVTDEVFKSYDPRWAEGDLRRLTSWLGSVFTHRLDDLPVEATTLPDWRTELRDRGVYVTFSSGTTGHPSLVPRDRTTLAALRAAGGTRSPTGAGEEPFDCLVLVPDGMGLGIQSGAAGLQDAAVRHHRLPAAGSPSEADYAEAAAFLRSTGSVGRQVVVYGTPAHVARLCAFLAAEGTTLQLPAGSRVVTGGGWKGGQRTSRTALAAEVTRRLGVPPASCSDAYSTAELNTVFVTCREGRYHVPPVVHAVAVDAALQPLDAAEVEGVLAVLDPFALSYPGFVVTGDVVRLSREPCPCGLAGTTIVGDIERAAEAPARGCGAVLAAEPG